MFTIETRIRPATKIGGTKMVARCNTHPATKRRVIAYDHGLSVYENHVEVLTELLFQLGWRDQTWHPGDTPTGLVWVCTKWEGKHQGTPVHLLTDNVRSIVEA